MHILDRLLGKWRLRYGFCPLCNSSPPIKSCPVCKGDYGYGHEANQKTRDIWWNRFVKLHEED